MQTSLTSGGSKSCGCLRDELSRVRLKDAPIHLTKPEGESAFNSLFASYKAQARRRGYKFELTKEEFSDLTKQDCHYCGTSPSSIMRGCRLNGGYLYNGIDRKDNNQGYTIANSVPCCGVCNAMKMDHNEDQFLEKIKLIFNKLLRKD